jgi:hypothetical protein
MRRKKREQPNDGALGRRDDEARFAAIERERADEAVERPAKDDDFVSDAEIEAREQRSGTEDDE